MNNLCGIFGFNSDTPTISTPEWEVGRGWSTRTVWSGPTAQHRDFMQWLVDNAPGITGVRVANRRGAITEIEGRFPDRQDGRPTSSALPNVTWNRPKMELGKDIFDAPKFLNLNDEHCAVLREAWQAYLNKEFTYAITLAALASLETDYGITGQKLQKLFVQRARKVENYTQQRTMLQRVAKIPPGWAYWAADFNVGKVYASTVAMLAAEDPTSSCPYVLPSGLWLKHQPDSQQSPDGTVRYVQDFEHGEEIPAILYEPV